MILTILPIIIAALLGVALSIAWLQSKENERFRKIIKDLRTRLTKEQRIVFQFDNLMDAQLSENVTYFSMPDANHIVVLHRSFSEDGSEWHTFIKRFNDQDMEFNQREAEDLCEILNS